MRLLISGFLLEFTPAKAGVGMSDDGADGSAAKPAAQLNNPQLPKPHQTKPRAPPIPRGKNKLLPTQRRLVILRA